MTGKDNSQTILFNPSDKNCPVCEKINTMYGQDQFQQCITLPEWIGKGYFKRTIIRPSVEIAICEMRFYNKFRVSGNRQSPGYDFSFSFGEEIQFPTNNSQCNYTLHSGDNCVLDRNICFGITDIDEGQHLSYINIGLSNDTLNTIFNNTAVDRALMRLLEVKPVRRTSVSLQRILNDISHCNLSSAVKKIYLEAKVVELLAVYIDELLLEDQVIQSTSFTKDDMLSIDKAKDIIEKDIANTPSLSALARMVCLSEYKLQAGFKKLLGMTVYAYVIDRRLEKARLLLEHGNVKVSDVAFHVGYNELGRFAEKFRKKFGVNPSEYLKSK